MTTRIARKRCALCGKNRLPSSYVSEKGRTCAVCRKATSRASARRLHLAKTYGMEDWQVQLLLDYQGNACAICGGERNYNLPLDHDHSKPDGPESWRGFLCKRCNKLLRDVRDDPQILRAAADYIEDPPARRVFDSSRKVIA